jgi:uncharacterized protein YneF (UPF0154 family)
MSETNTKQEMTANTGQKISEANTSQEMSETRRNKK